jgi:heavy metal translocating P-type ATPase
VNRRKLDPALLAVSFGTLAAGGVASSLGEMALAHGLWAAAAALMGLVLAVEVVVALARGQVGVDLMALLSIVGALYFLQFLVGAVIAAMLASGRTLEYFSSQRAERELRRLVDRAPAFAWKMDGDRLARLPVGSIVPSDTIMVRMGDVLPLDGQLLSPTATLDESALTGEPVPVVHTCQDPLRSGCVNAGEGFWLKVTRNASDSTYAGIVRMAENAKRSRAPFIRAADRYALLLIPTTVLLATAAWLWSGDPLRALAVIVVSTPCPLILAAPIALLSGISRCARRGVVVKDGTTLEAMAHTRFILLDKTGTLTTGRVAVHSIESVGQNSRDELLFLAGALARGSSHPVSAAIAQAAEQARQQPGVVSQRLEAPGAGISGSVDGRNARLGTLAFVGHEGNAWAAALLGRLDYQGLGASFIACDDGLLGAILFTDPLRRDAPAAVRSFRRLGAQSVTMITGDRLSTAQWVGIAAGVDDIQANLGPEQKVETVQRMRAQGVTLMVGDGINDAPALAAADVGIAMGANGAGAASQAAGVVVLLDRLDRIAEALAISQRTWRIARQSIMVGMGLSVAAMLVAAAGYLPPLAGALLQEAIDVGVILNALRALGGAGWQHAKALDAPRLQQLRAEHTQLQQVLDQLASLSRNLRRLTPQAARGELNALCDALEKVLLPHERSDERQVYPLLMAYLRGNDPLAALSHMHREIFRLARLLSRLSNGFMQSPEAAGLDEVHDTLIRLDALVTAHFAQEDELYSSLDQR